MKKPTCKDCKFWKDEGRKMACCEARNMQVFDDNTPMCADFIGKDGKRPRFCRLASSADEMADALVIPMCADGRLWNFVHGPLDYTKKEDALLVAKKWLMEVEE